MNFKFFIVSIFLIGMSVSLFIYFKKEEKILTVFDPSVENKHKEIRPGYATGTIVHIDSTIPGQLRYVVSYDFDTTRKTSAFSSTVFSVGTKVSIKKYWYIASCANESKDITVITRKQ